jgi:hypothetical protein
VVAGGGVRLRNSAVRSFTIRHAECLTGPSQTYWIEQYCHTASGSYRPREALKALSGGIISYQVNALRLQSCQGKAGSHLRAPPAKLHQDPPFPTTSYLPTAPHIALLSRTHSNTRHSPVVLQLGR